MSSFTGYRLRLEPASWEKIHKHARNAVRKAEKTLTVEEGTLEELRILHWNPVYLPRKIGKNQRILAARLGGQPVASVMITLHPETRIIHYSYAGSDPEYSELNGNSLLLWKIAEEYTKTGKYDYLDLGGSTQPGIARFKEQFSTETYPSKQNRSLLSRLEFRLTKWLPFRFDRMLQGGGRIQRIQQALQPRKLILQPHENRVIHVGCDDVNLGESPEQLQAFREIHDEIPEFRVTFFTVPYRLIENKWLLNLLKEGWIHVGLHGYRHTVGELWDKLEDTQADAYLKKGMTWMQEAGVNPAAFKPPRYRSNPRLTKFLESNGITQSFLSNDQYSPLSEESIKPTRHGSQTLYPTNYSVWTRNERRIKQITRYNGYLSIQSHTVDFPRHSRNLKWIIKQATNSGYNKYEDYKGSWSRGGEG